MESSRRSAKVADADVRAVAGAVTDALARRHARWPGADGDDSPVLVAYSGGLDSTVLLQAVVECLGPRACVAAHVHHGLQPAADAWPAHCVGEARRLGVRCEVLRLAEPPRRGENIEQWAREERYRALLGLARQLGARVLLTAHHADDQAETLLMRLARGTGVAGAAGVHPALERDACTVLRPLLALRRSQLLGFAQTRGLHWIEDPSNGDTALLRNAIRHRTLPALEADFPGIGERLVRFARSLDEAREAVDALARIDLDAATLVPARVPGAAGEAPPLAYLAAFTPGVLRASALTSLSSARRRAALRCWLVSLGLPAPGWAQVREMERQLLVGATRRGEIVHHGTTLRRDRDYLFALPPGAIRAPTGEVSALTWRGEDALTLRGFVGVLRVEPHVGTEDAPGVSSAWLRNRPLVARAVSSALRLRPHPAGPSRSLKLLFQERGFPASVRPTLPGLFVDGQLLFVAGLGMDTSARWPREGPRVRLRWVPAASASDTAGRV